MASAVWAFRTLSFLISLLYSLLLTVFPFLKLFFLNFSNPSLMFLLILWLFSRVRFLFQPCGWWFAIDHFCSSSTLLHVLPTQYPKCDVLFLVFFCLSNTFPPLFLSIWDIFGNYCNSLFPVFMPALNFLITSSTNVIFLKYHLIMFLPCNPQHDSRPRNQTGLLKVAS